MADLGVNVLTGFFSFFFFFILLSLMCMSSFRLLDKKKTSITDPLAEVKKNYSNDSNEKYY